MKEIVTDVLVIGAGPAGLSAAYQASKYGADVVVIDENKSPGGQLFKQIHKFFGSKQHHAGTRGFNIGEELLENVKNSKARVFLDGTVYALLKDKSVGAIINNQNYNIKAKKIILATGAKENYMPFTNSTLPGVMGAGAAQTMINVNRVLPGERVIMVGSGNVGLIVAYQLLQAGAEVLAIVEGADNIGGYGVHASKLRRAGVPIYTSHTIKKVYGEEEVTGVEIVALDSSWKEISKSEKYFDADTVCLAVGLNPMTELAWMAGCEFKYIKLFGGHVPIHDEHMQTTVEGIYVAGDITGVEEASSAMEEGNLAGVCVAYNLGYLDEKEANKEIGKINDRLNILRSGIFGEKRRISKEMQLDEMKKYQVGVVGGKLCE